ncbi:MAG: hypothetical protein KBI01_10005 [Oscillospiraceae bacterium]|nr:hypothetical protein [Oscillospiraceae bacterium]
MDKYILTPIFKESVNEKDISGIRTSITECIYRDPTFQSGAYEAHMDYVNNNGVTISEPYQMQSNEFVLTEGEWDDRYFYRLVEWFRLNFAPDERIPKLKEVGKRVFVEKATKSKEDNQNFRPVPGGRRNAMKKPSILAITGATAAAVVVILILIRLIRNL